MLHARRMAVNWVMYIVRESEPRLRPLYARRQELVKSKLENHDFWPRVFAAAPADIDNSILSSDAEIIGTCLKNVNVERFELNDKGEGEPRSVRITFEFNQNPENIWIEDEKVVKTFYWRKQVTRTKKGKYQFWEGLISEPVRIHWKKDHDPTKGLLDAACNLFDAEKKAVAESGKKLTGEERTKLAEYEKLVSQVEKMELEAEKADGEDADDDIPDSTSFFAFFGYRGPDVAAEESAAAAKEDDERFAKVLKGETLDDEPDDEDDEDEDDEDGLEEAEIFPDGESLATDFADDLFPNALQYYREYGEPVSG